MPSTKEYYTQHKRGQRAIKRGEREDLKDKTYNVKFGTNKINLSHFKKLYKDKIRDKQQEYVFNICLDLIELIKSAKECLEVEGAYVRNITGTLKVNPAQKELRENLKAFNTQFEVLNNMFTEEELSLDDWLDDE